MTLWFLRIILFIIAFYSRGTCQSLTQVHDLAANTQRQSIEAARYAYRIEGDLESAKFQLKNILGQAKNEEILTEAHFLLGRILEKQGKVDSAMHSFLIALNGAGLPNAEKLWLYHRLLNKSPDWVTPIAIQPPMKNGPAKVYRDKIKNQTFYTLEFRNSTEPQWNGGREIFLQNEMGDLKPTHAFLSAQETILDADATQYFVYNQESKLATLRSLTNSTTFTVPVPEPIELGAILKTEAGACMTFGSGIIKYYQLGNLTWEKRIEQEGCTWNGNPLQNTLGTLHCADNQIYLVDLRKKKIQSISGAKEKALQVFWENGFLAIRYMDRVEIRHSPNFETVKWGVSCQIQEKLSFGNERVYLITTKGLVKSYKVETGQMEWQKDILANQLVAYDGSLFASTFAQTIICLDRQGKVNWTYEFGWDREPILLPNEKWLVLQYNDGRRIKLSRELLRITGNANHFKLSEFKARQGEKDLKGSLTALEKVLIREPGNGEAWKLRSEILKLQGAPRSEIVGALIESARSQTTPNWSSGKILKGLSMGLGANWIWKRQFGPKFYPNLIPHKDNSFYLENDNQTLVLLNHENGELINSFHFSEELDMKVSMWKNDTICVSSPSRLYLLAPALTSGGLSQFPLKNPVCQAQSVSNGIVYSDWYGGLNMLGLPDRTLRWERKLGQSGLLVGKSKMVEYLDILDQEGKYFAIQPTSGKILWSLRLPPGTITETFSNKEFIYAGYSQGTLICIDRNKQTLNWLVDFGEQIFSLSGNKDNTLVLTTASKKLLCIQASTGAILSQVYIQSYLFNRPTVFDHGYWLGTTEPALEKRNFNHELILKYKLPDLPGSPVMFGNSIFIGTLDNFILSYPF